MSTPNYRMVTQNIELAKDVIRFFMAEVTDNNLYKKIKSVCIKFSKEKSGVNFISLGYFSIKDCIMFISQENTTHRAFLLDIINVIVNSLEKEHAINTLSQKITGYNNDQRYRAAGDFGKFLNDRNLLLNIVCGWQYIIENYSDSVVKIEHEHANGNFSIGTGFYFAAGNTEFVKPLIITNRHVLENAKFIKVYSKNDELIKFREIIIDSTRDLGFILLEKQLSTPIFHFNPARDILEEILTIGYPSIPMTKEAYQTYHKGELNSFVEDYSGNQLFLFSAKTSSGNSGSPIIDRFGMVIGIVTEELFEQDKFYEKGKLPYYAGIPTDEIIKSLNEIVFV